MSNYSDPAQGAGAVTPDADLPKHCRALYVGTGGDLAVLMSDASTVTLKAVPAGSLLPIRVRRVLSDGTTASDIVALY